MLPDVKRILFCTQLGPRAAEIFRYAYVLAEKFDARILALHVVETLSRQQEALVEGYVGPGRLHDVVEREEADTGALLRQRIEEFCHGVVGAEGCDRRVEEVILAEGHAAQEILRVIEEKEIDLVVIGAHARSAVMKAMLGSTAQRVIRGAPVPVLVVGVRDGV